MESDAKIEEQDGNSSNTDQKSSETRFQDEAHGLRKEVNVLVENGHGLDRLLRDDLVNILNVEIDKSEQMLRRNHRQSRMDEFCGTRSSP